jgi:hypothetical protein
VLLAKPALLGEDEEEENDDDDDDDDDDDGTIALYHISATLYGMIKGPRAEHSEDMKIANLVLIGAS